MNNPIRGQKIFRIFETTAFGIAILIGVTCLLALVFCQPFDYDEIEHAHAAWLVSTGLVPFKDFFECHPPFFWYILSPLIGVMPHKANMLFSLRLFAAIGNFCFILLLVKNMRISHPDVNVKLLAPSLLIFIIYPTVVSFCSQFRMDGWSYALMFYGIYYLRKASIKNGFYPYLVFSGFVSASVLLSPKFIFFAPIIFICLASRHCTSWRATLIILVNAIAGALVGLAAALAFLGIAGISAASAYTVIFEYHRQLGSQFGFVLGLSGGLLKNHPRMVLVILLGLLAWIYRILFSKKKIDRYELAITMFLAIQLLAVRFPYTQYVGPWLLLTMIFIPVLLDELKVQWHRWAVVVILVLGMGVREIPFVVNTIKSRSQVANQVARIDWMNSITNSNDRVVAFPPLHPIFRRDAFYGWVHSWAPDNHGTEFIMRSVKSPFTIHFQELSYRNELEQWSPSLVIMGDKNPAFYYPIQSIVLGRYLQENKELYEPIAFDGFVAHVKKPLRSPQ